MVLKCLINVVATVLVLAATESAVLGQTTHIDYDSFMQGDLNARISTFQKITAENKAEIVRTQIERWLEVNRGRLTAEQIAIMEENLAFVTPEVYEQSRTQSSLTRAKDLEARSLALLSREDVGQALTIHGAYIPKP